MTAEERLARHRFGWVAEPLLGEPSLLVRPMFGCVACYVHGRLMLVLADRRPPWRGLLVPTSADRHRALRAAVPGLVVHRVLRKWLFLPDGAAEFEAAAQRVVALARADDARLGVEPAAPRPGAAPRRGRGRTAQVRARTGRS